MDTRAIHGSDSSKAGQPKEVVQPCGVRSTERRRLKYTIPFVRVAQHTVPQPKRGKRKFNRHEWPVRAIQSEMLRAASFHFFEDVFIDLNNGVFDVRTGHESRAVGSVLGTLTLRYPIPCTRFSPYLFGGAGGIFGGGEKTNVVVNDGIIRTEQTGSESRAIGQVGGGMEVRFTPHIGWVSDFSWNFVDGPKNNFGMVRTGVNFAF